MDSDLKELFPVLFWIAVYLAFCFVLARSVRKDKQVLVFAVSLFLSPIAGLITAVALNSFSATRD